MYKIWTYTLLTFVVTLLLVGCQSEFETIRKNNDYELKYQKAVEYYENEDWYKAQTLFEQLTSVYRGSDKIEKIYYYYANCHYKQDKFILGSYYFKNFSNTFPNSDFAEDAKFMTAYCNYMLSPTARLDQTSTGNAIEDFQLFINTYPKSDRVPEANRLIDELRDKQEEKAFAEADLYYKLNDYRSANHTYRNVIREFPDAEDVERARFMVIKSSYKLAANSIDLVKEKRFMDAIDAYSEFIDRHPNSGMRQDAETIYQACKDKIEKLNQ